MSEPRPAYNVLLPPDINLAIMVILSFHLGRRNAISSIHLCASIQEYNINERRLCDHIKHLRRSGHLIGSASGENGGYYLIPTPEELQDFLRCEYQAKIIDMRQTVDAMTKAASQRWGPDTIQLKLI